MRTLAQQLFASGREHTLNALAAHGDNDSTRFALDIGLAVELLAKSVLADLSPVLLADSGSSPSAVIWLAMEDRHGEPLPSSLRTIQMKRVLELAGQVRDLTSQKPILDEIRNARNAVAHMGADPAVEFVDRLPEVVKVIQTLVGPHTGGFFGEHTDRVDVLLASYEEEADRECRTLIAVAAARFALRSEQLGDAVLDAMRALVLARRSMRPSDPDELVADCPACQMPLIVVGSLDADLDEYDLTTEFHARHAECDACGLRLDTPSLIARSGVLDSLDVPSGYAEEIARFKLDAQRDRDWHDYIESGAAAADYRDDDREFDDY